MPRPNPDCRPKGDHGSSCSAQTAVQGLNARGILVVASAGNDGIDTDSEAHIPSSLPVSNIIAVAAIDIPAELSALSVAVPQLSLWTGSNYGTHTVHIAAPGVQARRFACQNHRKSHVVLRLIRHRLRGW